MGAPVGGATVGAGVIGTPIRHSLSPALFNAAFAAVGLDWVYLAFDVAEGAATDAVSAVRALGLAGLSVTMPHKEAVLPALDRLTDDAAALTAVNCIAREGNQLVGLNTDGPGLVDALRLEHGIDPTGARCVVVGAGGAGRSVARALGLAGAAAVLVVNRTEAKAAAAAALAGPAGAVAPATAVTDADIVINATSIGMAGAADGVPFDTALLSSGQRVVDLVYHPATTALLAAAAAQGAMPINGLGMLVHQAAHAFRAWTGEEAPVDAMRAGALEALAARESRVNGAAVAAIAAVGVPVGSFLNVVIDRVPSRVGLRAEPPTVSTGDEDAPLIRPTQRWIGLPVSPWMLRRRREELPRRWLLVEMATVVVFGALAARYGDGSRIVPLLVLGATLVAVTFVDIEHLRIPDRITFPALALLTASILGVSVHLDAGPTIRAAVIGAVVYFGLLLVPHLISPRGMGFGDVKLAVPMGLVLGWMGWHPLAPTTGPLRLVLYALMLGSFLGVVFGLAHAALTRQRGAFPFGPALAAGCLIVVLFASELRY